MTRYPDRSGKVIDLDRIRRDRNKARDSIASLAARTAGKSADGVFAVGALCWSKNDPPGARSLYFVVATSATSDADGEAHFDRMTIRFGHCPLTPKDAREAFITMLAEHSPRAVHHDFPERSAPGFPDGVRTGELEFLKQCESLWPGENVTRARMSMEADVAAGRAARWEDVDEEDDRAGWEDRRRRIATAFAER
jgi:hypothetical protein